MKLTASQIAALSMLDSSSVPIPIGNGEGKIRSVTARSLVDRGLATLTPDGEGLTRPQEPAHVEPDDETSGDGVPPVVHFVEASREPANAASVVEPWRDWVRGARNTKNKIRFALWLVEHRPQVSTDLRDAMTILLAHEIRQVRALYFETFGELPDVSEPDFSEPGMLWRVAAKHDTLSAQITASWTVGAVYGLSAGISGIVYDQGSFPVDCSLEEQRAVRFWRRLAVIEDIRHALAIRRDAAERERKAAETARALETSPIVRASTAPSDSI